MAFEMDLDLDNILMEDRDCRDIIAEINGIGGMDIVDEEEYQQKLEEQKRKREEYLAFKAQRRRQTASEHEFNASLVRREIEEKERQVKVNVIKDKPSIAGKVGKSKDKKKPLAKVDINALNKTLAEHRVSIKKHKPSQCNNSKDQQNKRPNNKKMKSENERFGATTVLIQNLSAETNEFTIKQIGETVGNVIGVCVALEGNVRKAMARFKSPVDALLFQKRYDNYQLGSTLIKTTLMK